jgi:hypothetical protein
MTIQTIMLPFLWGGVGTFNVKFWDLRASNDYFRGVIR